MAFFTSPAVRGFLTPVRRVQIIVIVLALTVALTPRSAERYGDNLQIALPMLAWGCEAVNGSGAEYLLRYAVMLGSAHGSKFALGNAPINRRPDGGGKGMPSAHTSTAVFGASSLVQSCVLHNPVAQGVVILSAAFVGASRISSHRHDIWQVLIGALLGWLTDRAFRRDGRGRRAVIALLRGLGRAARRGLPRRG